MTWIWQGVNTRWPVREDGMPFRVKDGSHLDDFRGTFADDPGSRPWASLECVMGGIMHSIFPSLANANEESIGGCWLVGGAYAAAHPGNIARKDH